MAARQRADVLVHALGLAESREKAKALIMANRVNVIINGQAEKVSKPGHLYLSDCVFSLAPGKDYVSRGAYKLLTIIEAFNLNVAGLVCLDAGASTGGFTDCLLRRGAARVYAVDVGKNQLHEKLRADARVISREGVNLRHAPPTLLPEKVDFLCGDLSFISLTQVLPNCMQWLKSGGLAALLIKPQFELGPEKVCKGVVRNVEDQLSAVDKITCFCRDELDMEPRGCLPAKIRGPRGNQEYMALFAKK